MPRSGSHDRILRAGLTALALSLAGVTAHADLVQYWEFDDGSGNSASNEVVTGNTGTLTPGSPAGGPTWTAADAPALTHSSAALSFNPSNAEYVNGGVLGLSSTSSGGQASVSVWVNANLSDGDNRLFGQLTGSVPDGGATRITGGGAVEVWDGSAWNTFTGAIVPHSADPASTPANWRHLAFVWTNDSVTAYLSGVAIGTETSDFDYLTGNFGIGSKFLDLYGVTFRGLIDDVSVWNHALTAGEVESLAAGASPLAVPEPSGLSVLLGAGIVAVRTRRRPRA